eukprot:CAMPEP_0169162178 /NCGR_PEP_ID=MMETSP1015-20121227/57498_1 /TAXON_ID=342587 /ORGANISM="Karlodinium micrum, Strain CCMP2283" /LENGTH=251 /DNA_ID=CAMNT_0009234201 /DNA_START=40 /DNA_END=796 /DNA_ORIENTATION=-
MARAKGILSLSVVRASDRAVLARSTHKDATDFDRNAICDIAKDLLQRNCRPKRADWKEQADCGQSNCAAYAIALSQGLVVVAGVHGRCRDALIWETLQKLKEMVQTLPFDTEAPQAMVLARLLKPMQVLMVTYNEKIDNDGQIEEVDETDADVKREMIRNPSSPRFSVANNFLISREAVAEVELPVWRLQLVRQFIVYGLGDRGEVHETCMHEGSLTPSCPPFQQSVSNRISNVSSLISSMHAKSVLNMCL